MNAASRLSMKFGADMPTAFKLIDLAIHLNLNLVGISFHVGSGQMSPSSFNEPIENSRKLFDYAAEKYDCHLRLLDIGGGFPGSTESNALFTTIAQEINKSIDNFFPEKPGDSTEKKIQIIAEPGTYYACSAFTVCLNIISKRVVIEDNGERMNMYYVNDGVFTSFIYCLYFNHLYDVLPSFLKVKIIFIYFHLRNSFYLMDIPNDASTYKTIIWGPTCDGLDFILKDGQVPDLDIGDYLVYKNMGAYTIACATSFNGIPFPRLIYSSSKSCWNKIKLAFDTKKTLF